MPIRPFNTLTWEELIQLLNNPAFYECFEFAYDMYHLRQRFVQFTATGEFAARDPPAPVITPSIDPFGGITAPMAGAPDLLPAGVPISSEGMASASAPRVQQQESSATTWAQSSGTNYGTNYVAPFDMEAAPVGPGINVGQDQTLNSLTHGFDCTPAQAALPQFTDLANDSGMNGDWDSLFDTATYSGAVQGSGYDPLSSAQAQTQTPVSPVLSFSLGDANNYNLFSNDMPGSDVNGGLPDVHEESSASLDNTY